MVSIYKKKCVKCGSFISNDDGDYVLYADYARLEKALRDVLGYLGQDEYEEAIKKAREVLKDA